MIAELKVENNHLPMETCIFQVAFSSGDNQQGDSSSGGKDTFTLRAEDWNHSVAFNLILEMGL